MKDRRAKKGAARAAWHWEIHDGGAGPVSFVMTLWLEPQEAETDPEWRWRVCHVPTGEQAYFRRLDDVIAFVASRSGLRGPQ